ncbi:ABC transporter C member 13 [Coemansia sp. RSA 1290]|nr:ABC transporter C member 13 [Coemansia sp. RSA 1290]
MRTIKQYAWESKLLKMLIYKTKLGKYPWHYSALETILKYVWRFIIDIALIIVVFLYTAKEASITYIAYSTLLFQIRKLCLFSYELQFISCLCQSFGRVDKSIQKLLDCHRLRYIPRKQACQGNGNAVELDNCVFSWGGQMFQLQPLQLTIKHGEFITVVGRIGSGKSSLLSAICGEMPLASGGGCVYGSIGYVSQKPWIMNATFRDNVLFGNAYDKQKYSRVIAACALVSDIEQLPAKDATEIGPKGVNLSGGQKARLALARAIYNNANIYILDDILSAVDAHVERHLIEHVLAGNGILRDKTRILVTHAEHVVPLSNCTFRLDDGQVSISRQDAIEFHSIVTDRASSSNGISGDGASGGLQSNNANATTPECANGAFTIAPEFDVPQFSHGMLWNLPVNPDDYIGELINGCEMVRVHNKVDIFIAQLQSVLAQNVEYQARSPNLFSICSPFENKMHSMIKLGTVIYAKWLQVNNAQMVHPSEIKVWIDMCTKGIESMSAAISNSRLKSMLPILAKYFVYAESLEQEAPHHSEISLPKSWPQDGRVAFKSLSMRYRDSLPMVLNGVTFSTDRFEKIGIVGRTGAGKSSLTLALLRLIEPASGYITIDGIDISTVGLYDLRSRISMVPQDPMLLEGTIRDNLDPAYEYSDKEVLAAIEKSCIGDLLFSPKPASADASVPDYKKGTGLDTWVEADGSNFSIGQRQLISLCRALLWKRTILVLDEATANIDSQSDKLIQSIIRKEFKNCTVLTIAHRLKTVMDSDRILVMDQGKIAEFDTPSNLMAQQGIFAELVESTKFNEKQHMRPF